MIIIKQTISVSHSEWMFPVIACGSAGERQWNENENANADIVRNLLSVIEYVNPADPVEGIICSRGGLFMDSTRSASSIRVYRRSLE